MSNTQHAMPDARDNRIAELETQVEDLTDTIQSQRNTIDALQQTNQLLAEQLEEKCKQLESSNEQFINSRGLNFSQSDSALPGSLSIDENSSFNKESNLSETTGDIINDKYHGNNAQSIKEDYDDIYSSGDDIETYTTKIHDDHELLPLKQGTLKKKSENMHRYNNRYVILYSSFLLYYDQCPIKPGSKRKNSMSSMSFTSKNTANNDINHPKGTIYLRNYHVAIRKDDKKKRFDITFVPHDSAVMMGLAAVDARIRFRCKNVNELLEWTDKIRTAITSANSGFIKYDVRTDFISNDLSNLNQATGDNDNKDENEESKDRTKMFDINDLKEMMKKEEELQNEIAITKRMVNKLEQEKDALKTELEMKKNEILQGERVSKRREEGLEAKMKELKAHEKTLKDEIENLRKNINKLEQKQKEQHKKLKRYKHHEQDIQKNIELMQKWNKKMEENSLQYLGQIYPKSSSKQLFETCQKGCVGLLEEIYSKKNKNRGSDVDVDDGDCKIDQNSKKRKESKISQEIIGCFIKLFRKHIKTTINYASLQQAHNGVVEDLKLLKQNLDDYDEGNTLEDDALIMASMTATLF